MHAGMQVFQFTRRDTSAMPWERPLPTCEL